MDFASVGTFVLERGSPLWNAPLDGGIAAIDNVDKLYPIGFDLDLADGRRLTSASLRAQLRALHAEFAHLAPLFENAVDRALVMFFPPKQPGQPRTLAAPEPRVHRWRSQLGCGEATLDLHRRRIEIANDAVPQ